MVCLCGVAAAHAQNDDFADGVRGPQWTLLEDAPSELSLAEQGGRLDVIANDPANNAVDALYLSDGPAGFRLGTTQDFELTLDYALGGFDDAAAVVGDLLGLTFGVGRDLDGTDSAAIGFGVGRQAFGPFELTSTALAAGYRIDDAQQEELLSIGNPAAATFRIAYDAASDDLSLGVAGGSAFVLEDTVRGIWQAESLYASFGARGGGFSFAAGDAWLDNFQIVSGDVIALAGLAGDYNANGLVEQGDLDLVLSNWGLDTPPVPAGWVGDPPTGLVDQGELDRVLQQWGVAASPGVTIGGRPGIAVPEPAGVAVVGLAAAAVGRRRGVRPS